ncbi:DUF4198 domain-containing protein [Hirschia baltica]|uniref:ABC-type transport system, periplasmic component n=1 Tax=Hirschia baltica (strain ATCC 49814 / DSM 5838 / IFAM 1418) TaxID=582402 RepID=C6XM29_HIRBI|nr:DUF4198 domain-containing protein [Hirschia baltica]ACT59861.1 ABC-type transport system, periplasmic component [Hirschia baltica ATCC 49814]
MKLRLKPLLMAAAIGLAVSPAAQAHRMWILPSTFTLSGDEQIVTLDGAISNDLFFPNHVAMNLDNVVITAPDGSQSKPENGWKGEIRSTFDLKLDQQGTYKVAELGDFFFASWSEGDEKKRKRGSWEMFEKEGILAKEGVELSSSARRSETFVTLGAPTETAFKVTGVGIEMIPITHPNDVYQGEEASFTFLVDGKAVADLEVTIVKGNDRYRDVINEVKVKTDKDGVIKFTPEVAGRYWMSASSRKPGEKMGQEMMLRSGYSATFEALIP